jgi:two-component system sensor histidine kinase/response regulator
MELEACPVLYVDDDNANRVVMRHNLGSKFKLLIADSGPAALEIMEREPISVLLTDQRMPQMTGVELATRVRELYPEVVRVIITAYSDLEATVDAINSANVSRFVKKPWTREELVAVVNESIETWRNGQVMKRMRNQLMQLDRMTSLAIMAGSIAHDLRQPLSYMEPSLVLMREDLRDLMSLELNDPARKKLEEMAESVHDLGNGLEKFQTIATTLLESLRNKRVTREMISLNQVIQSALDLTRSTIIHNANLQVELLDEPVYVMGSEGRTIQLLVNLLLNANQALTGPASENRIGVRLSTQPVDAVLEIEDNGCGIPPEKVDHVFQPFFTTKGQHGTGLGLAICKQIVDELDGTIHVDSTPGKGTRFVIALPRLTRERMLGKRARTATEPPPPPPAPPDAVSA